MQLLKRCCFGLRRRAVAEKMNDIHLVEEGMQGHQGNTESFTSGREQSAARGKYKKVGRWGGISDRERGETLFSGSPEEEDLESGRYVTEEEEFDFCGAKKKKKGGEGGGGRDARQF